MDQIKIGKFIAECRKNNNLTQMQLAEKLNITDRAVSKWENGKSMPDSSIMLDLCNELKISVNELLSGERIDVENYNNKTDELLVELAKENEDKNKKILKNIFVFMIIVVIFYLGIIALSAYMLKEGILLGAIICISTFLLVIVGFYSLKIYEDTGYYKCNNCNTTFTTENFIEIFAPRVFSKKYLKCPKCNKRTWAKKVMVK